MALTLNLVVPALAAMVAGTGAFATFATGSTSPIPATIERPCAAQTWPFIDSKCIANAEQKRVRVVAAPRADEIDAVTNDKSALSSSPVPQASPATPAATPNLTSRDTVLRQPEVLAPPPKVTKPREKRSAQRQWNVRSYQVPAEAGPARSRAMIVVRPLRLEAYR